MNKQITRCEFIVLIDTSKCRCKWLKRIKFASSAKAHYLPLAQELSRLDSEAIKFQILRTF